MYILPYILLSIGVNKYIFIKHNFTTKRLKATFSTPLQYTANIIQWKLWFNRNDHIIQINMNKSFMQRPKLISLLNKSKLTTNCTSLSYGGITVILLWLSKRFNSGQVCSVLNNKSFHSAKFSGQILINGLQIIYFFICFFFLYFIEWLVNMHNNLK